MDQSGPVYQRQLRVDRIGADLVVVGTHGRGGPERRARVPLGSVTERLLEQSTVPMLVVPVSPANDAAGAS